MTAEMHMHDKKFIKINQNDKGSYLELGSRKLDNLYFTICPFLFSKISTTNML